MRERIKVDQELIKSLLAQGMKPYSIGIKLKIPRSVPDRILLGKDVPYYYNTPKKNKKGICEVCKCNKIHPGFRKLCWKCFKGAESEDEGHRVVI